MPVLSTVVRSGRGLAVIAAFVLLSLTGCGLIQDRSNAYQEAQLNDGLSFPDWFKRDEIAPLYPIPDIPDTGGSRKLLSEVPVPPDLTEDILEENYVVESAGGQTWLLINELPGRVWPSVANFLTGQGLTLAVENPRVGLMQSAPVNYSLRARQWLGLEDMQADARDEGKALGDNAEVLLQARVSPGVRRRTTEVQFRLRERPEGAEGFLPWVPQSDFPEREERLLADLGEFMKAQENVKSYSRAALDIAEEPRVRLVAPDQGSAYIELDLSYDRAWSEVSRALGEADVPLVDIDRSEGLWYVDYRGEEERTHGWWFWEEVDEARYTYLVKLERDASGALRLTTSQAPDYNGNDRSERLLSVIFEYLY